MRGSPGRLADIGLFAALMLASILLVTRHANDKAAYTGAKGPFIAQVLAMQRSS